MQHASHHILCQWLAATSDAIACPPSWNYPPSLCFSWYYQVASLFYFSVPPDKKEAKEPRACSFLRSPAQGVRVSGACFSALPAVSRREIQRLREVWSKIPLPTSSFVPQKVQLDSLIVLCPDKSIGNRAPCPLLPTR